MRTTSKPLILILALLVFSAYSFADESTIEWSPSFEKAKVLSKVRSSKLAELSGLVASHKNEGLYWAHNDSGNDPSIYLLDPSTGEVKLEVELKNTKNKDFEDIAIQQIQGKTYILIADIGDNRAVRSELFIYRILEPKFETDSIMQLAPERMTLSYQEGPRDAETLMADGKNVYLLSKREDNNLLYRFEFKGNSSLTAESIGKIAIKNITAGDIRNGEIALRTYPQIYFWPVSDLSVEERLLTIPPQLLDTSPEPQAEAIAFTQEGDLISISEKPFFVSQLINFYKRTKSDEYE
ncbi:MULTISPECIES: hypothetical protein [unclassified Oleiphilus]|nr:MULTISPECIES: hypothetical protein [unclassified Oleiphilus]KZY63801.1 hypothetical protein A3738_11555 [Oleiphilus sp. HI0066]KZY70613.1 hypothetical protein A3739_06385 [Oleiphilus sp. HI0067]